METPNQYFGSGSTIPGSGSGDPHQNEAEFLINTMIDDSSDVAVLPGPLFHRTGEISFLKLGGKI